MSVRLCRAAAALAVADALWHPAIRRASQPTVASGRHGSHPVDLAGPTACRAGTRASDRDDADVVIAGWKP